jgi:hypothetical protein
MNTQFPPNEELFEVATCIYRILYRYSTMDRQIIVSILSELIVRELER